MTTTTIADAITRLKIVKDATDGAEPTELAVVEAFSAVNGCLHAILDTYEDDESDRGRVFYALAMNALNLTVVMPVVGAVLGGEHPVTDTAFTTFACTVELLIDLHDEDACTQVNVPLTCDDACPEQMGCNRVQGLDTREKYPRVSSECPNPAPACTPAAPEEGSDV